MGKIRFLKKSVLRCALVLGSLLTLGSMQQITGVQAEEAEGFEEDLLIEDDGELVVISAGSTLEAIQQSEEEARKAQERAETLLEEVELVLPQAQEESVKTYLEGLLAVESPTGTDGELQIAQWISDQMEGMGYTVTTQAFHEGFLNDSFTDVPGVNIIAERGANSENRTSGILLLCAHYDSKTEPLETDPYANDKSGAAALLETARILKDVESDVDVCFLFLSGEEDGLFGSLRFAETLTAEQLARIQGVIYLGTVGAEETLPYLLGTEYGAGNSVEGYLAASGRALQTKQGEGQAETEIAENTLDALIEETVTRLPDWTVVADEETGQINFARVGLQAVTLFQDVQGKYSELSESQENTSQAEDGTQTSQSESEADAEATALQGEDAAAQPDVSSLCFVANVLAETAGLYMTSHLS